MPLIKRKYKSQRVATLICSNKLKFQKQNTMDVAIRPKLVSIFILNNNVSSRIPLRRVFVKSVRLDKKIIDILWTPVVLAGDPRNTKNQ